MMTAKNKSKEHSKNNAQTLTVAIEKGENEQRRLAEAQFSPDVLNTLTTQTFTKTLFGEIDFTQAVAVMKEKTEKIIAGDLNELESTLTSQVVSLNAIFNTLARKAAHSEFLNQMEANMRLALKAQAQCARTVEVLAAIKNPPIVYAKQANIAAGHQQINNGNPSIPHAPARKTKNSSNELLNEDSHAVLDTGRAVETGGINQKVATVEIFDGR
ncbi:hypothetical protein [Nitrosomonas oligotropha]|nr:hypothetical protein [Nitrosomonas oligotropha]